MNRVNVTNGKIKKNENILAVKIKTESNGLGVLKTLFVMLMIAFEVSVLFLTYAYYIQLFQWYLGISIFFTFCACIHVLSSDYHGQAKAMWVLFLLISFGFGYIVYLMSDKRILFAKSKKKLNKIENETKELQNQIDLSQLKNTEIKSYCDYLYNSGNFVAHKNTKTKYYPSGASMFDDMLEDLNNAKDFIFIEYFIIADGVLLNRCLDILKKKASEGVDVRIIYDDMGSHSTLKLKTKKKITSAGIKLQCFNRLVPVMNIALNLRDHRKIVVIDGKVGYTGGTNLADEYINEKRTHGYWKDTGIRVEGSAVDNLTLAFLSQWKFIVDKPVDYHRYINLFDKYDCDDIVVPFISGPDYQYSIAQNIYVNAISGAKEKLYIMTPYFVPDETITSLLINKAKAGVDIRIILPEVADKKFVYIVSRNNAEKLMDCGVRVYTMNSSFVHAKVVYTENCAIVGSINMDLRSFNQQFESAVLTNSKEVMRDVDMDFEDTISCSTEITGKNKKRKRLIFRIKAGLFNLISPFM